MSLTVTNLKVARETNEIVHGLSLAIAPGEVHALMGPNGSGKTSLANALMGHPKFAITDGSVALDGEEVTALPPNERAQKGLFLSMQHPPEVAGVAVSHFLRVVTTTSRREPISVADFRTLLRQKLADLKIDPSLMQRGLNEGFSGGEKKRMEALQLALLEPKYAVLDETDAGLDVDALKIVAETVARARERGMGVLLITHTTRILKQLSADRVHVMAEGRIVKSGGMEIAEQIERDGYGAFIN